MAELPSFSGEIALASIISGSKEAAAAKQGVEIVSFGDTFESALPRILSNSTPIKVLDGRNISANAYWTEIDVKGLDLKNKFTVAPNHQAEQRDLGYPKLFKDGAPFEEIDNLDPINFVSILDIQAQYPVVLNIENFLDPGDMNGIIEPIPIRIDSPILKTEGKQKAKGIKAELANFNYKNFEGNFAIEQKSYFYGNMRNITPYLEWGDISDNQITLERTLYVKDQEETNAAFIDRTDSTIAAEKISDPELAAVIESTTNSWTGYGVSFKSATAGYVFNDEENGTDSIAFGDRLSLSQSLSPRRYISEPLKVTSNTNVGFQDSSVGSKVAPFNANRVIEGSQYFYPSIRLTTNQGPDGKVQDISVLGDPQLIAAGVQEISDSFPVVPFNDEFDKSFFSTPSGTGSCIVKINISSENNASNRQYAGRTDSEFASRVSNFSAANGSLFLSSALGASTVAPAPATGISGTGFLYYSPSRKAWIEKRKNHSVSKGVNTKQLDYSSAKNGLEVNFFTGSGDLALDNSFLGPVNKNSLVYDKYVSKQTVTGTVGILKQFTASPQLGYFAPYKESLLNFGYDRIGTPTSAFGAPFDSKYHAFDEETIKLSSILNGPFLLKKAILKVPASLYRRHIDPGGTHGYSAGTQPNWVKDVVGRKDMDNYVFFLYRQIRKKNSTVEKDSQTDIDSSMRFLIASGSVCLYNSASFGGSFNSGFYDIFGSGSTIALERKPISGSPAQADLKGYSLSFVSGTDPFTRKKLTRVSSPLHTPSVSINANLTDLTASSIYSREMMLEVELNCGYCKGGFVNPTLMYLTTSTGNYSSSIAQIPGDTERIGIYNRYPYTGSYRNSNPGRTWTGNNETTVVPPVTTLFGEYWFGGTVTPPFSITNSGEDLYAKSFFRKAVNKPQYSMDSDTVPSDADFLESFDSPNFDIEVGRTGFSFYNRKEKPLDADIPLMVDGRGFFNIVASSKDGSKGVLQRTDLINFGEASSIDPCPSLLAFSSSFDQTIAALTLGYVVPTPAEIQVQSEYILFPEDELVLGLDAGVTPPPDVAPAYGNSWDPDILITDGSPDGISASVPAAQPILKEEIWHHAGASYLRILGGEAELILIGDYLQDSKPSGISRTTFVPGVTHIGDQKKLDTFDIIESDYMLGTYRSNIMNGKFPNRYVADDGSRRNNSSGANIKRFYTVFSDSFINYDFYFNGMNESPNSAFRNRPDNGIPIPSRDKIGGESEPAKYNFRGQSATKAKPTIFISANYNPNSYGQFRDLFEGIPYTQFYDLNLGSVKGQPKPVVENSFIGTPVSGNLSPYSRVDTPFFDED